MIKRIQGLKVHDIRPELLVHASLDAVASLLAATRLKRKLPAPSFSSTIRGATAALLH